MVPNVSTEKKNAWRNLPSGIPVGGVLSAPCPHNRNAHANTMLITRYVLTTAARKRGDNGPLYATVRRTRPRCASVPRTDPAVSTKKSFDAPVSGLVTCSAILLGERFVILVPCLCRSR